MSTSKTLPSSLILSPISDSSHSSAKKKQKLDLDYSTTNVEPSSGKPVPLQRRRVWRACESCRRKKIKCDGHEPVCNQCTQGNTQCTWIQTKDRAALSRHYVQELEARLVQMESLLTQVAPVVEFLGQQPGSTTSASSSSTPTQTLSLPPPHPHPHPHPHQPSSLPPAPNPPQSNSNSTDQDDPEEDSSEPSQFGRLELDGNGHLRWIGGSSTLTLIEAFRNFSSSSISGGGGGGGGGGSMSSSNSSGGASSIVSSPSIHEHTSSYEDFQAPPDTQSQPQSHQTSMYFPPSLGFGTKVRALPGPEEVEYPPLDLASSLVEAYFLHIHPSLPVLDQPSFMERYERLMREQGGKVGVNDSAFVAVVFAVFANGVKFLEGRDERLSEGFDEKAKGVGGMGMVYYERAMILYYIGHTATQLAHVQAFVLLSSFLASLNYLPQSWLLCGQAVRTAQDLGLHRSPRHLMLGPIDKETRRKVWWCVYGLDRMLAIALGRPLGIEDMDCDVELPLPIDDTDLPTYFSSPHPSPPLHSLPSSSQPTIVGAGGGNSPPAQITAFIHLTSLYRIAGRILRALYSPSPPSPTTPLLLSSFDEELTEWCDGIDDFWKRDVSKSMLGGLICSQYYAVLITLHRHLLPVGGSGSGHAGKKASPNLGSGSGGKGKASTAEGSGDGGGEKRSQSMMKVIDAARSYIFIAPSIKDSIPPSHHLAIFIQYLFSSGVIILLCLLHSFPPPSSSKTSSTSGPHVKKEGSEGVGMNAEESERAMREVGMCIDCLSSLEGVWPGARRCREIVEELREVVWRDGRKRRGSSAAKEPPRFRFTTTPTNIPTFSHSPTSSSNPNPNPHKRPREATPITTPSSSADPLIMHYTSQYHQPQSPISPHSPHTQTQYFTPTQQYTSLSTSTSPSHPHQNQSAEFAFTPPYIGQPSFAMDWSLPPRISSDPVLYSNSGVGGGGGGSQYDLTFSGLDFLNGFDLGGGYGGGGADGSVGVGGVGAAADGGAGGGAEGVERVVDPWNLEVGAFRNGVELPFSLVDGQL